MGATHIAYQWRTRLPLSAAAGGLLEDALVMIGVGTLYANNA